MTDMTRNQLSVLACPLCKSKLTFSKRSKLSCQSCRSLFDIRHGVPILVDLNRIPDHLIGQIRYFKAHAAHYPMRHVLDPWQAQYVNRLLSYTGRLKGKVAIDIACGVGYVALELAKKGAFVVACDLNLTALVRLRKVADKMGLAGNLIVVCCSAESLPIRSNSVHILAANAILEHLPRERAAILDMSRIAKRGAIAMITVPLAYHLLHPFFLVINFLYDRQIGHLRRYTKEMLLERFKDWRPLDTRYSGHVSKVFKTLVNIVMHMFDETEIEKEDEQRSNITKFASNISIIFRKR